MDSINYNNTASEISSQLIRVGSETKEAVVYIKKDYGKKKIRCALRNCLIAVVIFKVNFELSVGIMNLLTANFQHSV